MDKVNEKVVIEGQNQIISYEIDAGILDLGYIYENKNKSIKATFELFEDKECDFVENAFYKNPILKEELINSKLNFYFFEYLSQNGIKNIPQTTNDLD